MNWNNIFIFLIFLIIAVVLYFLLVKKRRELPLEKKRRRGRPLEIIDPPIDIPQTVSSKSKINIIADNQFPNHNEISFITERVVITPITKPGFSENQSVISCGDENKQWNRSGLFEIHIFFSLHNWSYKTMNVYDIHSRLYHVSAGYSPLAIGYVNRYRVDLSSDNSILNSDTVFIAEHGSAVYIELVFEIGFYDDTGTTLAVFGLDVDFELSSPEGVSKWSIPSDKIYTVQHWGPPYGNGTKVHLQDMDADYISAGYNKYKNKFLLITDSAAAQTLDYAVIYECIGKMFVQHERKGIHRLS